jgi:beta-N-acetylhexosaminidase
MRVSLIFLAGLSSLFGIQSHMTSKEDFSLDQMTLEEKVGQLLMVHFRGENSNKEAQTLIRDVKVGGFIYYNWANGLHSPKQVRALSNELQNLAQQNKNKIPLLIAADQEGGLVARLNEGFTQFPGNRALGETGDPNLAKAAAFAMGQELKSVGVNMNLAPVVDVNSNPLNPIIGIRAYGDSTKTVSDFGQMAVEGFHEANVIATLKHFPGHGDVEIDSHADLPVIHKSMEELKNQELPPFKNLAPSVQAIMTAHLLIPALDEENCSTLSSKTLTYLKEAIGFTGVIISDSLVMKGVLKNNESVDVVALKSLNSGCDILLLGGKDLLDQTSSTELTTNDIKRIHKFLVDSVKSGKISEDRLNCAVAKILKLKKQYLFSPESVEFNPEQHTKLARHIASLSLKTVQNKPIPNISEKKILVVAPSILSNSLEKTSLLNLSKTTDIFYFHGLTPTMKEQEKAKQMAESAELFLICSYNAWKNPEQAALIQSLIATDKTVILIATRDPIDTDLFPEAGLTIKTFSPTRVSLEATSEWLKKNFTADF